jgi:hypothetical protein
VARKLASETSRPAVNSSMPSVVSGAASHPSSGSLPFASGRNLSDGFSAMRSVQPLWIASSRKGGAPEEEQPECQRQTTMPSGSKGRLSAATPIGAYLRRDSGLSRS